ncbi:hypothetical protein MN032_17170 [Agromyces atrinae]|uniref:hypothetical protein n=1 Tax=Agromyces atrinae TaxID=592376 RepID=UPI001F571477|nr:hypothetical protein [Agromyces atrinae]MCI2959418.1 hypothetical protein [Agromyces atrinae]
MKVRSIAIAAIAVCALTSCSSDAPAPVPPSVTSSPAATATPYAVPEVGTTEIARATFDEEGAPQSGEIIISGTVDESGEVRIDGDCDGTELGFRVITAATDDAGRTLLEGTLPCGTEEADPFTYTVEYAGLVQITLASTAGSTKAWVRISSATS